MIQILIINNYLKNTWVVSFRGERVGGGGEGRREREKKNL